MAIIILHRISIVDYGMLKRRRVIVVQNLGKNNNNNKVQKLRKIKVLQWNETIYIVYIMY